MNRKPLIILLAIWICSLGVASELDGQNRVKLDSLLGQLPIKKEEQLLDLYLSLATEYQYAYNDPDSLLLFSEKALKLSRKLKKPFAEIEALRFRGYAFLSQAKYDDSKRLFRQSLREAKKHGALEGQLQAFNALGSNFYNFGQIDSALTYFLKASNLGLENELEDQLCKVYGNIAMVLFNKEDYNKAVEYNLRALNCCRRMQDPHLSVRTMVNLSLGYQRLEKPDSALHYATSAKEICTKIGYTYGALWADMRLAYLYLLKGNFEQSLTISRNILDQKDQRHPDIIYNGYYYHSLALDSLGKWNASERAAQQALYYAHLTQRPSTRVPAYQLLSHINRKKGNHEAALHYFEQAQQLEDSLLSTETASRLTELENQFEKEKQERVLAELDKQNRLQAAQLRNQRLLLIIGLLLSLLIILAIYIYNRQKVLAEEQNRQEVEQRLLRLQMNPHFFFNSLMGLQRYLVEKKDVPGAAHYLVRLSSLMRQVLENSRQSTISMAREIEGLKNYLQLQSIRYQNAFSYHFRIDPELDLECSAIPPMIAQPFVENAIEHGRLYEQPNGEVIIRLDRFENQIRLQISDNGVGRSDIASNKKKATHNGLATKITRERLQLLKQISKQNYSFHLEDQIGGGTKVVFFLPLEAL